MLETYSFWYDDQQLLNQLFNEFERELKPLEDYILQRIQLTKGDKAVYVTVFDDAIYMVDVRHRDDGHPYLIVRLK